ncbi:MAG: hypothetical protein MUC48_25680 [Leptolyngbya sp. Prado105]|nr:hypothetical protein [Leptolyngbya sp. Prado105]
MSEPSHRLWRIGAINFHTFISFNVIGSLCWTFGLTVMGYLLEKVNPDVDKYLLPIILIIIVVSLLPSLIHIYQEHKSNRP